MNNSKCIECILGECGKVNKTFYHPYRNHHIKIEMIVDECKTCQYVNVTEDMKQEYQNKLENGILKKEL